VNIKTTLKASVAAAALLASIAPVAIATPASAGSVNNGNDVSVTLTGRFNKMIQWVDDGVGEDISVGDNQNFRSRFWLTASGKVNEALTVSGRAEVRLGENTNSSSGASEVGTGAAGPLSGGSDESSVTESWVQASHKQFGTIKMGLHEVSTDGMGTQSYNPAGEAVSTAALDAHGGINVIVSGANTTTALTTGSFFANYEGGDENQVSYISPNVAGFFMKAHLGEASTGAALGWGGKFGGISAKAYGGYRNTAGGSTSVDGAYGAGVAVKHDSGISASFNYTKEDTATGNAIKGKSWSALVGYEANLTSMGATGFAVEYMKSENTTVADDKGVKIAVGVQQDMGSGVTVYGAYHRLSMDRSGVDYEDISAVMGGMVLNF
jgi:hypothetical protein